MLSRRGTPVRTRSWDALWSRWAEGDREHHDSSVGDEEGELVGSVQRAAVLDHTQPPSGDLFVHTVIEGDDAVGHVLLDAVPGDEDRRPFSPVAMAVRSRSFNQANNRVSSARTAPVSCNALKRISIESSTTRFAPSASTAAPSRMNRPSRSYSPVSTIIRRIETEGLDRTAFRLLCIWSRSKPRDSDVGRKIGVGLLEEVAPPDSGDPLRLHAGLGMGPVGCARRAPLRTRVYGFRPHRERHEHVSHPTVRPLSTPVWLSNA